MNERDKQEFINHILQHGTRILPTYAAQNRRNAHHLIEEINEDVRFRQELGRMNVNQFIERL